MKKKESSKANVTVQDIAKAINISASTVSRALNNHPKISQKTKEKVWEAARQLGYQPNIPVYLNPKQSRVICFMVPEINNSYYQDIIESVRKYAFEQNYHLFIAPTNNMPAVEKSYIESLINLKVEGVIVALFNIYTELNHFKSLLNNNIPTLFINKNENDIEATTIIPDIFNGAYKASKHLLSMKCKNIHIVTGNPENPLYADIIDGYQTALGESGILNTEMNIHKNMNEKEDVDNLLNLLFEKKQMPDGIISGNAEINTHIISWLDHKGIEISKDLLLVSFETGYKEHCYNKTVSSVLFSGSKIGKIAVENLFKQIRKRQIKKETIIIPAKFIIRASSIRI